MDGQRDNRWRETDDERIEKQTDAAYERGRKEKEKKDQIASKLSILVFGVFCPLVAFCFFIIKMKKRLESVGE